MNLFKGQAWVAGRRSDIGLYDHDLATYDEEDRFDHTQAEGFVKLWGLPTKVWARRQGTCRRGEREMTEGSLDSAGATGEGQLWGGRFSGARTRPPGRWDAARTSTCGCGPRTWPARRRTPRAAASRPAHR
jgi:hypothetical protein